MHTPVLFEHPLNEKMRTWLRIEFLIQQMAFRPQIASHADALHFFRNMRRSAGCPGARRGAH